MFDHLSFLGKKHPTYLFVYLFILMIIIYYLFIPEKFKFLETSVFKNWKIKRSKEWYMVFTNLSQIT